MSNVVSAHPPIVQDEEDLPHSVGNQAKDGTKKAAGGAKKTLWGIPSWAILALGGIFVVSVLALLLVSMFGKKGDTVEHVPVVEQNVTVTPQPPVVAETPLPTPSIPASGAVVVTTTLPSDPLVPTAPPDSKSSTMSAQNAPEVNVVVQPPAVASAQPSMEAQMLQERMREVEDRVDDFMRSYAGQTPLMRRIILNRLSESGHGKASVQPGLGTRAASSVRKSATRKTASKTRKTTAKRRVGGSSTRSARCAPSGSPLPAGCPAASSGTEAPEFSRICDALGESGESQSGAHAPRAASARSRPLRGENTGTSSGAPAANAARSSAPGGCGS